MDEIVPLIAQRKSTINDKNISCTYSDYKVHTTEADQCWAHMEAMEQHLNDDATVTRPKIERNNMQTQVCTHMHIRMHSRTHTYVYCCVTLDGHLKSNDLILR